MKSAKVFALPFSLLCLFSAANAAEWDDCLVRAYVPAKNGEGESPARVASFIPRVGGVASSRLAQTRCVAAFRI